MERKIRKLKGLFVRLIGKLFGLMVDYMVGWLAGSLSLQIQKRKITENNCLINT